MHTYFAKRALLVTAAMTLLVAQPLGAGEQLTMRVTPGTAFAPATVVIDAVVQRDSANRAVQIQLDSQDYFRSSLIQLDGDEAPITTTVRYEGVPGGVYEVGVTLLGSAGRTRAATVRRIEILSNVGR